jgi:hypothetical protein
MVETLITQILDNVMKLCVAIRSDISVIHYHLPQLLYLVSGTERRDFSNSDAAVLKALKC